jgi:hypothetical protein
MNRVSTAIILLCAAAAAPRAEAQYNLIVNPGFESGDVAGYDSFDARHVDVTTDLVHSGDHAAKLNLSQQGAGGIQLFQQIDSVTPYTGVTLTGFFNVPEMDTLGWADSGFRVDLRGDKFADTLARAVIDEPTAGWQEITLYATVPTDSEMWLAIEFYGVRSGSAYVDSLSLLAIPAPTAALGLVALSLRRRR